MAEKLGSPWVFIGVGLLGIAIGAAIIMSVTGALPVQGRLQPGVTNWIVVCAGIVFAGIGGVFALTGFSGTRIGGRIRARAPVLFRALKFLGCGGGARFARHDRELCRVRAGPRAFVITLPFVGPVLGAELIGRIFFGAVALLLWGVVAVFVWIGARGVVGRD